MSIQLHMATTSVCNARCHFCIYKSPENTRPKGFMDWDLFTKIIDEAAGIPLSPTSPSPRWESPSWTPFLWTGWRT